PAQGKTFWRIPMESAGRFCALTRARCAPKRNRDPRREKLCDTVFNIYGGSRAHMGLRPPGNSVDGNRAGIFPTEPVAASNRTSEDQKKHTGKTDDGTGLTHKHETQNNLYKAIDGKTQ